MAAIKLHKFLGIAPKVSPEHLPDGAGQTAHNVKLYSGDLLPYAEPLIVDNTARIAEAETIYGMVDPLTDLTEWLSWVTDVDIVVASDSSDNEQRIYYTGDGVPKVTTYALATTSGLGTEPYPIANGFYDLGLPLPTVDPTAVASSFTSATSTLFERDSGTTAKVTTATVHGLTTGQIITVRGFTGTIPETFNATNVRVTVTSTTTIEYFSSGNTVSSTADTNGSIDLAGNTITRDYTYTWHTPWEEESIAADPSETLFVKEGQTVTVMTLPTAAPAGDNFIHGVKVYRTLVGATGSDFFLLSTLWFPQTTTLVALTSNVATVTIATDHGFIVGDRFKLVGCTDSVFDITDGLVTVVINDYSFSYAVTNANITEKADTTGTLLHDVAETLDDTGRYWGDFYSTTLRERTDRIITLTTSVAHNLVTANGVTIASMTDTTYNQTDAQVTVINATSFSYTGTGGVATSLRERTANVTTLTTIVAHGYSTSDVVTISGMADATFDEIGVTITVTSSTAFTYANTAANAVSATDLSGLTQVDEVSTADTAGTVTQNGFTDDFNSLNLVDILVTDDYDKPKADMVGVIQAQNNMLVGFFDNQLCFAEPNEPHAWPIIYRKTFEYDIVGIVPVAGVILVLTTDYAYRVSGSDPRTLSISQIDTRYPCLSKRSIVNMGYGAVYASQGGLALWSPRTGLTLVTDLIYDYDIWDVDFDPSTIKAYFYEDKYFASHSSGTFMFERDEKVGGYFVTLPITFAAGFVDVRDGQFFYHEGTAGEITEWDKSSQPLDAASWKSKVIVTKDYINIGAARVIADYSATAAEATNVTAYNLTLPAINAAVWVVSEQLGCLNGPTDYVEGIFTRTNRGEINSTPIGGDLLTTYPKPVGTDYSVAFTLYQDKTFVFSTTITDDEIFRCPTGYKSDTFEVEVGGRARIRAIHIGETPDGLRKA